MGEGRWWCVKTGSIFKIRSVWQPCGGRRESTRMAVGIRRLRRPFSNSAAQAAQPRSGEAAVKYIMQCWLAAALFPRMRPPVCNGHEVLGRPGPASTTAQRDSQNVLPGQTGPVISGIAIAREAVRHSGALSEWKPGVDAGNVRGNEGARENMRRSVDAHVLAILNNVTLKKDEATVKVRKIKSTQNHQRKGHCKI
jgi:hypothetical protein